MSYIELTEEQEKLAENLVGAIYQDGLDIQSFVTSIYGLPPEAKTEIFASTIEAVSFHQREREEYVTASLFGKSIEDSAARRRLVWLLANSPADPQGAINKLGSDSPVSSVTQITDQEVLNQLSTYKTVEGNLLKLKSTLAIKYNVEPLLPLILNLPPEMIKELAVGIDSYTSYALGLKEESLYTDLPLPKQLHDLLFKISPSLPVFGKESTLEKINYLKILQIICQSIIENSNEGKGVSGEDIKDIAGKTMALTDCEILYK